MQQVRRTVSEATTIESTTGIKVSVVAGLLLLVSLSFVMVVLDFESDYGLKLMLIPLLFVLYAIVIRGFMILGKREGLNILKISSMLVMNLSVLCGLLSVLLMPNLVELPPPVYGWVDSVSVWLLSLALGIGVFLGIGIYRLKRFRILAQVTGSVTSVANALLLVGLVSQEFLSGILGGENTDTIIIVGFSLFIVALVLKIVLLYRAIPGSAGKR